MIRRLCAALLAAAVLLASWTAVLAEENSPLPEGSDGFFLRFGLIILVFVPGNGLSGWGAVICVPILLLLVYSSGTLDLRARYAAGFLLTSDLFLGAYLLFWDAPPAHILYTALLSVSLMFLALWKKGAETEKTPS